jgi:hypothetical protein
MSLLRPDAHCIVVAGIAAKWRCAPLSLPPTIHATGTLPRSADVVHRGGFGTASAGLRAGIPALVIPHLVDQFYWRQRIYELGAGLQSLRSVKLVQRGWQSRCEIWRTTIICTLLHPPLASKYAPRPALKTQYA